MQSSSTIMIGVSADALDADLVRELFELFKTPWEWAQPGRTYDVIVSTSGDVVEKFDSNLFLVYSSELHDPHFPGVAGEFVAGPTSLAWGSTALPVYGRLAQFHVAPAEGVLTCGSLPVDYRRQSGSRVVWRIGYDLLQEVRHLLADGQPASYAATPTLELHIDFLRQALVSSGVTVVEIAARPQDHDFICCLTHDIDFAGIRRHTFDRTLAGFILRASIGTLLDVMRGRRNITDAARNWSAVVSLPLVFAGLKADMWRPFADYATADRGYPSTFFLVPFKNKPGTAPSGPVEATRAVRYQITDVASEAVNASAGGAELAVHGIDAWADAAAGHAERNELTAVTGQRRTGIRMHWLYFSADSPKHLEAAGFDYDSTCGFNDAVGYRAGTSQPFRPAGTERLMELPLSIMDSAMFSAGRLGLSSAEAAERCRDIIANARRFGGTLVINWHCRSLAPDRLWGGFYEHLLDELHRDDTRVWFAAAGETVDWFRWRRSITFAAGTRHGRSVVQISAPSSMRPAGLIRVHRPRRGGATVVEERRFDATRTVDIDVDTGRVRKEPRRQPFALYQ
jgi:hypothetical protein